MALNTDNGGRGPCSAFGTCFLLLHPGLTDQEHPKKALELEHMHKIFDIAYIRLAQPQPSTGKLH